MSIKFWHRALGALPVENLTAGELKQKQQYEAELKTISAQKGNQFPGIVMQKGTPTPWDRAKAMRFELVGKGEEMLRSSAWVILGAISDWENGMTVLKQLRKIPMPTEHGYGYLGQTGGLGELTNAIIRDPRVFHIKEENWFQLYNDQVLFEAQKFRAWKEGTSKTIIIAARERLKIEGWDSVRPAIATTVRAFVMRGFIELQLRDKADSAVDFFTKALEVLEQGGKIWKDVPTKDRGVVFESTFARGVQSLRFNALLQLHESDVGPESKYRLSDVLEEAHNVLRELELAVPPSQGYDPGFISSFYIYPKGQAHAMIGFYHFQMARRCSRLKESTDVVKDHLSKAGKAYLTAADIYPEDDEHHVWYLHCALDSLYGCGTAIKETLPIMRRIRLAIPKMKKIWENSSLALEGRDRILQHHLWVEEDIESALKEGKFTMEDKVMPEQK